jgi:hypothetical protein
LHSRQLQAEVAGQQVIQGCGNNINTEQKYERIMSSVGPIFHELKSEIAEMFHMHKKHISLKCCAQIYLHPC